MHSVQTIRLQVEYVLLLFPVVHCTVQNLLTFLGKEGEMDLFIHYEHPVAFTKNIVLIANNFYKYTIFPNTEIHLPTPPPPPPTLFSDRNEL